MFYSLSLSLLISLVLFPFFLSLHPYSLSLFLSLSSSLLPSYFLAVSHCPLSPCSLFPSLSLYLSVSLLSVSVSQYLSVCLSLSLSISTPSLFLPFSLFFSLSRSLSLSPSVFHTCLSVCVLCIVNNVFLCVSGEDTSGFDPSHLRGRVRRNPNYMCST